MKLLKSVVTLAILLVTCAFPLRGFAWNASTYQQAVAMCARGNDYACRVMYQYQRDAGQNYGGGAGSPADRWVSPEETGQGGVRGVRPGPLSTYDFLK